MNGWGLPAVEVPDMTGYPGFRPPTQAELGDRSSMLSYLEEKDADIEKYRAHRLLEIARENVEGFIRIIDTYVGDDPVEMQRLSDVRARLVEERNFLETAGDGDGDGVLLDEDLCPEECARGMDADLDGCIDRACGLKEEVLGTQMWWVARMVLLQKARLACWMDKRNKPRAAAGLLWAFGRLVRNFTRIGWIAPGDGERLQTFAKNARNAVLGYMGSLNCAPAGGWMEESRPARTNKPRPGVNRARPASARMR